MKYKGVSRNDVLLVFAVRRKLSNNRHVQSVP